MLHLKAIGAIVLMIAAALVFPVGGASDSGREDKNFPNDVLQVGEPVTIADGNWTYRGVTITSTGTLTVAKLGRLECQYIKLKNGALEVNQGTILLGNAPDGNKVYISGTASTFTLKNGARIIMKAPNGNNNLDTSQGGDAMIDVKVSDAIKIAGATIEGIGGNGYSNPAPWVEDTPLDGYYAAGGNGTVRIGTNLTPVTQVSDLTVTLTGGNGGRAADGQDPSGVFGGNGGGYSNAGAVSGHVGAGGQTILSVGGYELTVKNIKLTATGGKGGRAGDGGGDIKYASQQIGSGGGGGYGGGDGGDLNYYNGGGTDLAEDGGPVSDYVGSGGEVAMEFNAYNLSVRGLDLTTYGGRGGDAGTGGDGSYFNGGGGAGYGGGGGTYSAGYNGYNSGNKAGDGMVTGRVGAGGNISATFIGENVLQASNITLTAMAGDGGTAGAGGQGGTYAGSGGGGGYGGGGGGAYYEFGGDGKAIGEVGAGGNITVSFYGGPIGLYNSTFVLFGGTGGKGGAGGNGATGYNYAGGGGGGYGGGGGCMYGDWNKGKSAGAGTAGERTGGGGGSLVTFASYSGPGELRARTNKFYIYGGTGGDGGPGGLGASYSGGGGGGYGGGGGSYAYASGGGGQGNVGWGVGNGGDVNFTVYHVAPSLSKLNSLTLYGGNPGNGKSQKGGGTNGGAGTGRKTVPGVSGSDIPMGVPVLIAPEDGEVINAIPPTLEWEHIFYSTLDLEVISYSVQVDNSPDFASPEVDTGVEMDSTFTPNTELGQGGVYYWHVQATYLTGNTYGYGPARTFSFNTAPIQKKNIPLATFLEDNINNRGYHLINLSNYFTDDLFPDQLSYQIIYETDPSHILGTIDGNFITFTTPTPDWFGQERFAVRASDPLGLWANSNNFTVRVQPVNDAPRILPLPDINVTEGKEHFFDLTPYILDVDSKLDQMVVTTNSTYFKVDGLGLYLNYTPGMTYEMVAITVNDTIDQTVAILNVYVDPFNAPPVIINPPPWQIVMTEDTEYTMDLTGYAEDQETPVSDIVWNVTAVSAGNPPIFNSFIVNKRTLKIVPSPNANGAGSLVLVAIDANGKEDSRTVYVSITPVNDAPVIAKIPDVRLLAGATKTIDLSKYISDVDNSLSDLRLSSSSPMVSVEGLKVTIFVKSDTVENQDIIPIAVSDGLDTSSGEFLLKILFPPSIPQIIPNVKTTEDKVKELDLKEFVLDKDTPEAALKWEVSGVSEKYFSASVDPNTHILKITPKKVGKGEITLTVRDPDGGTQSQVLLVSISEVPKKTEIQSGVWVVVGFVIMAVVVGVALLAMRRRAGP